MTRLAALAFPVAFCRSSGQMLEACPAGLAGASCAAATAAAGEADGAVDLVQVLAARRQGGTSLLASSHGIMPEWVAAGTNTTPAASPEEALSGIWLCQSAYYYGALIANVTGGNASVHSSCGAWEAHLLGDSLNVTPPYSDPTTCSVSDGALLCSNGDACSKSNWALESLQAPENYEKYLGHWNAQGEGYEDLEGFNVSLRGQELFIERRPENMTGYVHLTAAGHWQAELCYSDQISTVGVRLQLSKSGREMLSSWLYPGALDWSSSLSMTRPESRKHAFPYFLVGLPVLVMLFGFPTLMFTKGIEGRNPHPQTATPASQPKQEHKGRFYTGEDLTYVEADSDAEAAHESKQSPLGMLAQAFAKPGDAPTQG